MYETDAELAQLQALIDESMASASPQLRAIARPGRRLSAPQVVEVLQGAAQMAVATVTASGEPRVSPLDVLVMHGRFFFCTGARAAKVRHLRERSAVSLAYIDSDVIGITVHGYATLHEWGSPSFTALDREFLAVYGGTPSTAEERVVFIEVEPARLYTFDRRAEITEAIADHHHHARATHTEGVTLRPITHDEYPGFIAASESGYADDLVVNGGWAPDAAHEKAAADFAALLPDGSETTDQLLAAIMEVETGQVVGRVWVAKHADRSDRALIVYDISIGEEHRGRGLGRAAMLAIEQEARARGVDRIKLNVFGGNAAARHLYESLGYTDVSVEMTKRIRER